MAQKSSPGVRDQPHPSSIPYRLIGLAIAASLAGPTLSGCALFAEPKTVPITQDYVGFAFGGRQRTSVFSTTAERRTVLIHTRPDERTFTVCAEPPADVAESITKALSAALEASVQQPAAQVTVEGKASMNYSFATAIVPLLYRSQGVQFFRDGLYTLCQAHMNRLITTPAEFASSYQTLMERSFTLILMEIPSVKQARDQMTLTETQSAATAARAAAEVAKAATDAALKAKADAEAAASSAKDAAKAAKPQ